MSWKQSYIVIRTDEQGEAQVVHQTETIKDAKYWLAYIALPMDALLQTPAHPKYEGAGFPTYKAHLVKRGEVSYDQNTWETTTGIRIDELPLTAPA